MNTILELYGISTKRLDIEWEQVVHQQYCPYLNRICVKVRKSHPEISIGTCIVGHGSRSDKAILICPHRFLERNQVFLDCLHLLTAHEPGNELHRIPEVSIPGGSVDYFLASVYKGKVVDFVGIELQAVDTTGTLWPHRQRFLTAVGVPASTASDAIKPYGMNWKMTAKTTLVQLHHKVETFERLGKRFVLVLQEDLLAYMRSEFNFGHVTEARLGDSMHFHAYTLVDVEQSRRMQLSSRTSTSASGIATCLGLQASPNVELEKIMAVLQGKISVKTLFSVL